MSPSIGGSRRGMAEKCKEITGCQGLSGGRVDRYSKG